MPTQGSCRLQDDGFIADLFFREQHKLVRYAKIQLRRYGPAHVDTEGRAEEAVQELFCTACDKEHELKKLNDPASWLYAALYFKVQEVLREDRKWVQGLMLLPSEDPVTPFPEPEELADFIPKEDYDLLKRLYLEGYTYTELCDELGVNKSNLGMRINRIKKSFKKKYGKIFS